MSASTTANKINDAIRACLGRCYASEMPIACIAEFIEQLRTDPNWRQAEVEEVETAVLRMLRSIVKRPQQAFTYPDNAARYCADVRDLTT